MHLVSPRRPPARHHAAPSTISCMPLLFAEDSALQALARSGAGEVWVQGAASIGADDAYLLLPDSARDALPGWLAAGDATALSAALQCGLQVLGSLALHARQPPRLRVAQCTAWDAPAAAGYAVELPKMDLQTTVGALRSQPALRALALHGLADPATLTAWLQAEEYLGPAPAPRVPVHLDAAAGDAVYVWSRVDAGGDLRLELVLFSEDEELWAAVRPLRLRLG